MNNYGKQVDEKDIIADVKKAWTKSGKKVGDIKSIELYIKPEEAAVYYVINKTETGAVAFLISVKSTYTAVTVQQMLCRYFCIFKMEDT